MNEYEKRAKHHFWFAIAYLSLIALGLATFIVGWTYSTFFC